MQKEIEEWVQKSKEWERERQLMVSQHQQELEHIQQQGQQGLQDVHEEKQRSLAVIHKNLKVQAEQDEKQLRHQLTEANLEISKLREALTAEQKKNFVAANVASSSNHQLQYALPSPSPKHLKLLLHHFLPAKVHS